MEKQIMNKNRIFSVLSSIAVKQNNGCVWILYMATLG